MGDYIIMIEGIGPHGNHLTHDGAPFDAEAHLARAVRDLVEDGHNVLTATLHAGGGRTSFGAVSRMASGDPAARVEIHRTDGQPALAVRTVDDVAAELRASYRGGVGLDHGEWVEASVEEQEAWRSVAQVARR